MIEITENILQEMVDAIVGEVHPDLVVLFGSRAQQQAQTDSDIDLLIVESEPFGRERNRRQELKKIRRVLSAFRVPKDILVYSSEEVARWQGSTNHIIGVAMRGGRTLYARS